MKCTGSSDSYRAPPKPKHVNHSRGLAGALRGNRSQANCVQQGKSGTDASGKRVRGEAVIELKAEIDRKKPKDPD